MKLVTEVLVQDEVSHWSISEGGGSDDDDCLRVLWEDAWERQVDKKDAWERQASFMMAWLCCYATVCVSVCVFVCVCVCVCRE